LLKPVTIQIYYNVVNTRRINYDHIEYQRINYELTVYKVPYNEEVKYNNLFP